MKKKLTSEFIAVVVVTILTFIIGGFFIAKSNYNDITELNLNTYLEMIIIEYEDGATSTEIVEKYDTIKDYLRITFMDPTGYVYADSSAEELENHLNRPEFTELGTAYIRHSATLNIDMMYLAAELDDGNFIRVSIPISSILPFANDFIGLSIVVGIIIIVLTTIISKALISNAIRPLKDVKTILKEVNNGEYTEILPMEKHSEINDLIFEINVINRLIAENISSMTAEKEKNDFLLSHMNQGLCVLDSEGSIVILNQYLRNLYRFNIDININKNFGFLFRDSDIQKSIQKAYENQTSTNTIVNLREEYYNVSITYLENNWLNQPSVILIFTDITSIKNLEKLKKDFFDNASHELKSPLTSIIGSSDLIMQGIAKDETTVTNLIERISEEAKRMNNLVMDMLTLSQYENQTQIQHRQEINIKTALKEVINTLKNQASAKNIKVEIESKEIYIQANYDEMFQLIKNLTENAIKYGKDSGNVKISIQQDSTHLILSVSDDGIGIPKEDQSRIFERFYRVDKARSKFTGGTGLGLSIVKHIIMNYEGYIELDSVEDKGTTISVYIPNRQIK